MTTPAKVDSTNTRSTKQIITTDNSDLSRSDPTPQTAPSIKQRDSMKRIRMILSIGFIVFNWFVKFLRRLPKRQS